MQLMEFVSQIPDFDRTSIREKILIFSWFLQTHRNSEAFGNNAIRDCFRELDLVSPDTSIYLPRMAKKRPDGGLDILRYRGGYKLEGTTRRQLDAKYGDSPSSVQVTKLLSDLPNKVPNVVERDFLIEAIACYRVKAFRASIVMVWNLTYDHMVRWLLSDASRLQTFNAAIAKRYPKKSGLTISKLSDFEELKESETIEILSTSNLLSKNIIEIMREKLKRRNIAAHPSDVTITQAQADDTITDLVSNVVVAIT